MKVLKMIQDYKLDDKGNLIPNGIVNEVQAESPLNINSIDYRHIQNHGEFIVIPYNDPELRNHTESLCYEIAEDSDWCYADCENAKLSLMINMIGETIEASLLTEIAPPKYTKAMEFYELELTADELLKLQWLLIQNMNMVA